MYLQGSRIQIIYKMSLFILPKACLPPKNSFGLAAERHGNTTHERSHPQVEAPGRLLQHKACRRSCTELRSSFNISELVMADAVSAGAGGAEWGCKRIRLEDRDAC
ncbi:hypothetical protein CEXT_511551 [Caerostris extrusa]|uniref:Uncharacterized protein n=1 Tax=Caerostris extrusa TaxID=172846 RepID=A0AAV4PJR9_CAEEX|nr:hypothetical protein CEXT_511551 [Caerostris extrusa]